MQFTKCWRFDEPLEDFLPSVEDMVKTWENSTLPGKVVVAPKKHWGKSCSDQRFLMVFVQINMWGTCSCGNYCFPVWAIASYWRNKCKPSGSCCHIRFGAGEGAPSSEWGSGVIQSYWCRVWPLHTVNTRGYSVETFAFGNNFVPVLEWKI